MSMNNNNEEIAMSEQENTIMPHMLENQREAPLQIEPNRLVDGGSITISAALLQNGTEIVVTWNAPDGHVSLAQYDTTEGIVTTLLDGSAPRYSPYNDRNIAVGQSYQYILTTLSNGVQYYSNLITVLRPHQVYPEPSSPEPTLLESGLLEPDLQVEAATAGISAALATNGAGRFVIVVSWHAPDANNSLARIDQTTGVVTTPLPGFQPNHSPYNDGNIQHGNKYQYVLTNHGNQYYSNSITVPRFPFGPGPIKPPPLPPEEL